MGMRIIELIDLVSYEQSGGKSVSYFTASWCGPCRAIKPVFSALSNESKDVKFLKIDIDENQELAVRNKVRSVPTFLFHDKGKKVQEFSGADEMALRSALSKLAGPAGPAKS